MKILKEGKSLAACLFLSAAFFLFLALFTPAFAGEQGVTADSVTIGMVNALTGPASALGTGVKAGAEAYFRRINAAGGVNGRKIKLVSYDDGYEPRRTVEETNRLIGSNPVFALFGYVGTPTSSAIMPLVSKEKLIYWAPFTGAEFLRNPVNKYVFNVRGSYFDEAETQVKYLTGLGKHRIGMFIQNDAYGLAVKGGVIKALRKRNMTLAGEGTYERNTENVEAGLAALKSANPDAVIMVGTYKAMAAFIRKAREQGFNPVFLNVSFVGTAALVKALAGAGDGVIITQVMPSPHDGSIHLVRQYEQDMKAAGRTELDYTDLEGYVDAVVFVEALRKAGRDLTQEAFLHAAESLNTTAGGLRFSFGPDDHQAMSTIYLTKIAGGKVVSVH